MLERLRDINEKLINTNIDNESELNKQKIIKKILSDDKCFFKIKMKYAYSILRDLEVEEKDLNKIYIELVDSKNII